jgi:hypothetical protein
MAAAAPADMRIARVGDACSGTCGDMKIEVSPTSAASALADFLQHCGCAVVLGDGAVEASPPDRSQTPGQARIELGAYVRVWAVMNPTVEVRLESGDVA